MDMKDRILEETGEGLLFDLFRINERIKIVVLGLPREIVFCTFYADTSAPDSVV
jgi:hypothetical protein